MKIENSKGTKVIYIYHKILKLYGKSKRASSKSTTKEKDAFKILDNKYISLHNK